MYTISLQLFHVYTPANVRGWNTRRSICRNPRVVDESIVRRHVEKVYIIQRTPGDDMGTRGCARRSGLPRVAFIASELHVDTRAKIGITIRLQSRAEQLYESSACHFIFMHNVHCTHARVSNLLVAKIAQKRLCNCALLLNLDVYRTKAQLECAYARVNINIITPDRYSTYQLCSKSNVTSRRTSFEDLEVASGTSLILYSLIT